MIGRRAALAGVVALAAASPASAQRATAPTIGLLLTSPEANLHREIAAFAAELAARGWTGARTPRLVIASAEDDSSRLPALARLVVAASPDAIVAPLAEAGAVLAAATATIPIVVTDGSDFVALAVTTGLARPSRIVSGFGNLNHVLEAKRLELLLEVAPGARRVGYIRNPNTARGRAARAEIEAAAAARGGAAEPLPARSDAEMLTVFDRARAAGVEALVVVSDPVVGSNIDFIVERSAALHLPAIYGYMTFARHGGLLTYAVDTNENWRGAARYVDRLLRGAKIAELPFQERARIALTVNLITARRMALTLPPMILAAADEVIE